MEPRIRNGELIFLPLPVRITGMSQSVCLVLFVFLFCFVFEAVSSNVVQTVFRFIAVLPQFSEYWEADMHHQALLPWSVIIAIMWLTYFCRPAGRRLWSSTLEPFPKEVECSMSHFGSQYPPNNS